MADGELPERDGSDSPRGRARDIAEALQGVAEHRVALRPAADAALCNSAKRLATTASSAEDIRPARPPNLGREVYARSGYPLTAVRQIVSRTIEAGRGGPPPPSTASAPAPPHDDTPRIRPTGTFDVPKRGGRAPTFCLCVAAGRPRVPAHARRADKKRLRQEAARYLCWAAEPLTSSTNNCPIVTNIFKLSAGRGAPA
jgi:hypothetical protein